MLAQLLANRDLLTGAARQGLLLLPIPFGHEQSQELNRQGIFQYRYLLAPLSDDDQSVHLQQLRPFQSGLRGLNHQLLLRQHLVRDAPLLTYRSLKSHQIHKLIYRCGSQLVIIKAQISNLLLLICIINTSQVGLVFFDQ